MPKKETATEPQAIVWLGAQANWSGRVTLFPGHEYDLKSYQIDLAVAQEWVRSDMAKWVNSKQEE